ncbi:MAG: DNA-protecting protein DprA [Micavibrio aeruginosavorus]|uniref:DNA-protecting protein DprA n=1 Tax=Micavibrio aeruginosavorus TaxID=349221 RepID=A0A2W5N1T3_9BACT|nr:MAG: DNA-protecting protein DprA [Micavibrio aeruginosavorus]
MDEKEKIAWLRLIRTENVGPITFYQLLDNFGSAQKAIEALPSLSRSGGRLKNLTVFDEGAAIAEMTALESIGGKMIFAAEKSYPLSLAAIDDAPPVLSVLGNEKLLNLPTIGMVGARNASLNGRKFAEKLARDLGDGGQMVASGLARGIDASAHAGALPFGTIAAVAGGADIIYPPENAALYNQIKFEGCIVAESPLGMEPLARHFPKRNRIISGLSNGVVVVEATIKSGSLITARMAAEQGRDVYAIPGHPFDPRAAGPNRLIRDGATLVQNADDILEAIRTFSGAHQVLEESSQPPWEPEDLSAQDAESIRDIILQNISPTPVTVDELVRNCHLTIPAVQMVLLELELAGRIQRLPANRIVLLN